MMGLQLTLILTCLFCYKALALKCYQCTSQQTQGTCPEIDCVGECASVRVTSTMQGAGAPLLDLQLKSCAAPAECINGSLNLGLVKTVLDTKCCKTDLCNSQTVSALPEQPPNGKYCYTCDGDSCSRNITCQGDENQCISTSVDVGGTKTAMKGCATKSFCDGISSLQQSVGMTKMSCCVGNLCNSGNMVNLSFLLMLGSLLPSFFH
ncbi:urokinase plasminogen activator surface receptor-like isoform X1 [Brachyhypopomus gauderio]|uniref:urokinase plasminogen activator surface receptor-like isoform X1 n=1 Tax=Brachyhypopomus gauderio TaxID=698409 RepID=UPI0040434547